MQNHITTTVTTVIAAISAAALAAPVHADSVTFEHSEFYEDGFPGGEFIANLDSGSSYRSFCLEANEALTVGEGVVYDYFINTEGAVSGGVSGGNPDPISSATASVFMKWLTGVIENTAENATAVQFAIWALEGEANPDNLDGTAESIYDEAVANFSTTDNAITDNAMFSKLRVLNPYLDVDGERVHYQSQIILIPLPTASGLALAGLAAIGARRRR